ncbi:MAG TPA: CBS domain-containing protein [Persephonella sp.]|uniref:Cbs domain containing protein n=1 Tax=Persephonella marina (strain DSM 14350 / EX-H1) TaxID=123214 RepID=C0QT28_PERMH|nr:MULTISPECIES: CBS domain-containing protein [Persephonella]ACO04251.1 cbs domain containing protein [Persephonella marina EX-H1]HCB70538.1 CBS domain-containing protein [Persephonella sp.]
MGIKNVARKEVITASPDTPVKDVAKLMRDKNVGSVVIVENNRPVGIVTDRDIAIRVLGNDQPAEIPVKNIMTENPVTLKEDEGIFEALERVKDVGVRRFPVVDNDGNLTGIVTIDDFVYLLGKEMSDIATIIEKEAPNL